MNSKKNVFTLGELGEFIPITEIVKNISIHHKKAPPTPKNDKNIFDMNELIEYLKPYNPNISRSTINKWMKKTKQKLEKFPFHKKGARLFFLKEEINKWLKSQ